MKQMMRSGYCFVYLCLTTTNLSHGLRQHSVHKHRLISNRITAFRKHQTLKMSTSEGNTVHTEAEGSNSNLGSWRSLLDVSVAKTRKIRGSNYVQLATVDNGEPRCRSIVFRGFLNLPDDHPNKNDCDNLSCTMKMCTDSRSKKFIQTKQQPVAELVWWFPKTSEQYRIRGPLLMIGGDADEEDKVLYQARKELWGNLSDPARESFLSTIVPGEEYSSSVTEAATPPPPGGRGEDGKLVTPPDNFLLMLMDPTNVDYLRLTDGQYRQIDCLSKDSGWSFQRVNP